MPRKTDGPRTREYVTRDPHTVALVQQDALAALPGRWKDGWPEADLVGHSDYIYGRGTVWSNAHVVAWLTQYIEYAIRAALDQAGAKHGHP